MPVSNSNTFFNFGQFLLYFVVCTSLIDSYSLVRFIANRSGIICLPGLNAVSKYITYLFCKLNSNKNVSTFFLRLSILHPYAYHDVQI